MICRTLLVAGLLVALGAATAGAQVSTPNAGEVIITSEGQPVSPWIEKKVCEDDVCRQIVLNPETREIARLNGRLTSIFELSGNGEEVRRAESAMDRALRLQVQQ
jgi:hypothetical protein